MKNILLKLIALLLLFAMLLPMAVSCAGDPPPSNEGGEENGGGNEKKLLSVKQSGSRELVVADFSAEGGITLSNHRIDELRDSSLGQPTLKWKSGDASYIQLPESVNVGDYYYLEFSLYSPAPSDAIIRINLTNCKSSIEIPLNFSGWKSYRIRTDAFSVLNPYPSVPSLLLTYDSGKFDATVYISNIKATTPIYELEVPDGIDINDPAIYKQVTARFRQYYAGFENGSTSETYNATLKGKQETNCRINFNYFQSTYANGEPNKLFGLTLFTGEGESKVGNGAAVVSLYERLNAMAIGYAAKGCEFYKSAELLDAIKKGLEYGYTYGYGADIAETGKTTFNDWYYSDVSIPRYMINTLVLIEDELTPEQITKYLSPFDKIMPLPVGSASNLMEMGKNVALSAALQRDALRMMSALELCKEVFTYVDEIPQDAPVTFNDGGFYSDGSFVQHTNIAYTGLYGINVISNTALFSYIFANTPFEIQDKNYANHFDWLLNSYRPLVYGGCFMATVMGRGIGGTESAYLRSIISVACAIRSYAPESYHNEYDEFIKYLALQLEECGIGYYSAINLPFIDYMVSVRANEAVQGEGSYITTKVFGSMDRVVHHGAKYGVALSLSSTRIAKYEAINGQNYSGWYQGDGMLYLYTEGYDHGPDFYGYANPYLMPGTTVNLSERVAVSINSLLNTSAFAGGVEHGKYGAAGFILGYPDDAYREYTANSFTNRDATKISAEKSYFFFDNEIVCIGYNINDFSGERVITTVENRLWRENDSFFIDGEAAQSTSGTLTGARSMYFTNMGGYVFLGNQTVSYNKAENEGRNFLEITLEHGTGDGELNGRYSYVYLPEAESAQKTEEYYENPDVEILKRNSRGHAVIEKTLGIVAGVFFEHNVKDTIELDDKFAQYTAVKSIEASTECAVMVSKNADGSYTVSVSDPTQLKGTVSLSVKIEGIQNVISSDNGATVNIQGDVVQITLNTSNSNGKTFNVTVK